MAGIRVSRVMTRDVYVIAATQSLPLAEAIMGLKHVRHIPVVDEARTLVGLVTHRDLLRAQLSALIPLSADERSSIELTIPVSRFMRTNVWTIEPDALVTTAARIMRDHGFGCLPVVSHGKLAGILTEADLLDLVTDGRALELERGSWTAEDAMTPSPYTVGPDATVEEARAAMTRYGVRHLPVVAGGRPIALLSDNELRVAEIVFRAANHPAAVRTARLLGSDGVTTFPRKAPLHEVMKTMFRERLDAVLVVDGERLVGVISASDACRILGEHAPIR